MKIKGEQPNNSLVLFGEWFATLFFFPSKSVAVSSCGPWQRSLPSMQKYLGYY